MRSNWAAVSHVEKVVRAGPWHLRGGQGRQNKRLNEHLPGPGTTASPNGSLMRAASPLACPAIETVTVSRMTKKTQVAAANGIATALPAHATWRDSSEAGQKLAALVA